MIRKLVIAVAATAALAAGCAHVSPPPNSAMAVSDRLPAYAGCLHHGGACISASLPAITDEGLGAGGVGAE